MPDADAHAAGFETGGIFRCAASDWSAPRWLACPVLLAGYAQSKALLTTFLTALLMALLTAALTTFLMVV